MKKIITTQTESKMSIPRKAFKKTEYLKLIKITKI